jgi:heme-degrading monooxygenase HmoA
MTITRIFRARIAPALKSEFEEKFSSLSIRTVHEAPGFISATILKPTHWAPDEYAMISHWRDHASLQAFAGEEWNRAVIPPGMEKFVVECWVHHYEDWNSTNLPK